MANNSAQPLTGVAFARRKGSNENYVDIRTVDVGDDRTSK